MTILSKDAILGASDIQTEDVPVPEWGGTVRVAAMDGLARDRFIELQGEGKAALSEFHARVLVACVVGEDGKLLFSADDAELLRSKSSAALDRVVEVAIRLNKLGADAVEESVKNSGAAPSGDSGSGSPSVSEAP